MGEGVGGLMVPLTPGYLVRDLAVDLGLPLVIAARTGLGTINHTLLTIEAARAARAAGGRRGDDALAASARSRSSAPTARPSSGSAASTVSGLPPTSPGELARPGSDAARSTTGYGERRERGEPGRAQARTTDPSCWSSSASARRATSSAIPSHRAAVVMFGILVIMVGIVLSARACPAPASS